jgi:hypothetical protein
MSLQRPNPIQNISVCPKDGSQGTGISLVILCTIDGTSGVFHASH